MYQVIIKHLPQTLNQNEIEKFLQIKDKYYKFVLQTIQQENQVIISFSNKYDMQQVLAFHGCYEHDIVWHIEQYQTDIGRKERIFEINADDSSDEEDTRQRINTYNINEKKIAGIEKLSTLGVQAEEAELSFKAHALGLKLLYSPKVNQQYYPRKEKHLKKVTIVNDDKLQEAILLALKDAIKNTPVLKNAVEFFHALPNDLLTQYVDAKDGLIQSITESILKHKREIFRIKFDSKLQNCIDVSSKAIFDDFIVYMQQRLHAPQALAQINYTPTYAKHNLSYQSERDFFNAIYYIKSLEYYRDALLIQGGANYVEYDNPKVKKSKMARLNTLNTNDNTPSIFPREIRIFLRNLIRAANSKSYMKTVLTGDKNHNGFGKKNHITFTEQYITCLQNDDIQSNYQQYSNLADQYLFIQRYLPCTFARFSSQLEEQEFIEEFGSFFSNNIVRQLAYFKIKLDRTILPQDHKLRSYDSPTFFAQVRLSNRTKTREIKQVQDRQFYAISKSHRSWNLFGNADVPLALETQEITQNTYRKDIVDTLGSYVSKKETKTSVVKRIADLCNSINVDLENNIDVDLGKKLAEWIRLVLKGKSQSLEEDFIVLEEIAEGKLSKATRLNIYNILNNITYLFFGLEATRNPSSLITNQMLLDLIIQGDMTWPKALDKMVMAPKGATSAANNLNTLLAETMPVSYFYQASPIVTKITARGIVDRELNVITGWQETNDTDLDNLPYQDWFGFTP